MRIRIWSACCKLVQKQTYTCLSTRYGIWFAFAGLVLVVVSVLQFGEVAMLWSIQRYAGNFHLSRYYDNIASSSFESRLCLPQPIDIVYTWVNGSDPVLLNDLHNVKSQLDRALNCSENPTSVQRKLINEERFAWKTASMCPYPNCLPANATVISGLPRDILISDLSKISPLFATAAQLGVVSNDSNVLFVYFPGRETILKLLETNLWYKNTRLNISELFYTSTVKAGHAKVQNMVMVHDLPAGVSVNELREIFHKKVRECVQSIYIDSDNSLALVSLFYSQQRLQVLKFAKSGSLVYKRSQLNVLPVAHVWKSVLIELDSENEDVSMSRFADNSELKYSLRSVEKFAPWVRKVFIVTNGQIPSWLDLDHPRVVLVTHEEIFVNKSHLPTFSSPAIETHIHRIPGLSKKFIYMNDDVFFGDAVWPDDFYTHSKGQKVFLSWPVPNCNEGCPASWINDKYCDKACNVSACDWDGGDCIGGKASANWQLTALQSYGYYNSKGEYCSSGCAHNWIGDRYCDANCNVKSCGFDAGDCGTVNLGLLYSVQYSLSTQAIHAPKGTLSMFVNLTEIFQHGDLEEGNHGDFPVLRTAVLSKKFRILSLTFFQNFSQTSVPFQILGYMQPNKTEKTVISFNVTVSTEFDVEVSAQSNSSTYQTSQPAVMYPPKVYNISTSDRHARSQSTLASLTNMQGNENLTLDADLKLKFNELVNELKNGDITLKGLNRSLAELYQMQLSRNNVGAVQSRRLLSISGAHRESGMTGPSKSREINADSVVWRHIPSTFMKYASRSDEAFKLQGYLDHVLGDLHSSQFSPFPWEKQAFFRDAIQTRSRREVRASYAVDNFPARRRLLDTYADSLLHVSRIYNKAFGYQARKVPAHMPHMVDRDVVADMQEMFWSYFDLTSSHQVRHPQDMQFAFSYNYFVIGATGQLNRSRLFDDIDTDHSGVLSDRELRTLAAHILPLPLTLEAITTIESVLKNCSHEIGESLSTKPPQGEEYFDKGMPVVTKELFLACEQLFSGANQSWTKPAKYRHEIVGEDDIAFKMIRNNVSFVLQQLDWVRKNRRKFVCLNDNLDHNREDTKTIRALLHDFYESFFPIPSQFELPKKFRNRFLYKRDLDLWIDEQKSSGGNAPFIGALLVSFVILIIFRRNFKACLRYFFRRLRGKLLGRV